MTVVAQSGCLCQIFGNVVVKTHLRALEQRHSGAYVVEHRGCAEGIFHIHRTLVLLGELQQLFARFGVAGDDIGFGALSRRDMQTSAHAHNGVEGGAHGAGEGASALDDVGVLQAVAAAEEFQSRGLVFHQIRPSIATVFVVGAGHPELVQQVVARVVGAGFGKEQRLVFGIVFRKDFHAVEHTVVLVLGARGKHHFAVAGQFEVHVGSAVVGKGDATYLGGAVFQHGNLGLGLQTVVNTQVTDFVAGKAYVVAFGHHVEGRVGVAP